MAAIAGVHWPAAPGELPVGHFGDTPRGFVLEFHYGDFTALFGASKPGIAIFARLGAHLISTEIGWGRLVTEVPEKSESLPFPPRTLVLVGLMGAGKTCIGKRLAQTFGLEFVDADEEIETAAGCSIEDIFARYGEPHFRDGERRVIARLLDYPVHVLATGGGAFMDPRTREKIRECGISVWLRADIELLLRRVSRRNNRPLLKNGDQRATLERLIAMRYPVYAQADITVDSMDASPDATVERVLAALRMYLASNAGERCDTRQQAAP